MTPAPEYDATNGAEQATGAKEASGSPEVQAASISQAGKAIDAAPFPAAPAAIEEGEEEDGCGYIDFDYDEEAEACMEYLEARHDTTELLPCYRPEIPAFSTAAHCGAAERVFNPFDPACMTQQQKTLKDFHHQRFRAWVDREERKNAMTATQWLLRKRLFLMEVARHIQRLEYTEGDTRAAPQPNSKCRPLRHVLVHAQQLLMLAHEELAKMGAIVAQHPEWTTPILSCGAYSSVQKDHANHVLLLKGTEWATRAPEMEACVGRLMELHTLLLVPFTPLSWESYTRSTPDDVMPCSRGGLYSTRTDEDVPRRLHFHTSLAPMLEERLCRQRHILETLNTAFRCGSNDLFMPLPPPVVATPRQRPTPAALEGSRSPALRPDDARPLAAASDDLLLSPFMCSCNSSGSLTSSYSASPLTPEGSEHLDLSASCRQRCCAEDPFVEMDDDETALTNVHALLFDLLAESRVSTTEEEEGGCAARSAYSQDLASSSSQDISLQPEEELISPDTELRGDHCRDPVEDDEDTEVPIICFAAHKTQLQLPVLPFSTAELLQRYRRRHPRRNSAGETEAEARADSSSPRKALLLPLDSPRCDAVLSCQLDDSDTATMHNYRAEC